MEKLIINSIGKVQNAQGQMFVEVEKQYAPALKSLDGFGHLVLTWWFSQCDSTTDRAVLQINSPYKGSPEVMGVFATRSPQRPNPIAITTVEVLSIDFENGRIYVPFIDAEDGTPILDIKPYTPSFDRVENPRVPVWSSNWPNSVEDSGYYDWSMVFNWVS